MTTRITWLVVIALAITLVAFAVSISVEDQTRNSGGFTRLLRPNAVEIHKSLRLRSNHLSITGFSNLSVYIRHNNDLVAVSLDMLDTCLTAVDTNPDDEIIIDSPYFYVQNGARAELYRGDIATWNPATTYQGIPGFMAVRPISDRSAVLQTLDLKQRKSVFIKSNRPGHRKDLLTAQVDGIFSTDGFLEYSNKANMLVYIYRYRNEFICIDTGLNVLRIANTIDTTSVARIAVAEVDGKIVMSKPPHIVNKGVSVDGNNLFVHSNLIAQNERVDEVVGLNTIDVYNILDGSYRFSFYVHDQDNSKLRTFKVKGKILIAVFPTHVVRYDLNPEYFRD